jgi:hypothetical protein
MKKKPAKRGRRTKELRSRHVPDAIDKALNQAAQDAVREHQKAGLPLAVWQDGQTVWIPADQVKLPNGRPARRRGQSPR